MQTTPTKIYTNLGFSPLKAQNFPLFDTLNYNFHECHFDHLCMSKKIAYTAFTQHPKNIKVHGVCHVGVRGVPMEVIQHEVTDENPTWLGVYCLFLFLTYYYQIQTFIILFFL